MHTLLLVGLALGLGNSVPALPSATDNVRTNQSTTSTDPLQVAARKALAGGYGKLPTWQLDTYRDILTNGLTMTGRAKTTTYCPKCSGTHFADGTPVSHGGCAAPRSVPMHTLLWVQNHGFLRVRDRGGAVRNNPSRSERIVIDRWVPDCPGDCWTGPGTERRVPYAVISIPAKKPTPKRCH